MNDPNLYEITKAFELIPSQVLTSATTTTFEASLADVIGAMGKGLALLSCGAGGSGNTCIVTIESDTSSDFDTNLGTILTFTTVGNTASFQQASIQIGPGAVTSGNVGKNYPYIRAKTVVAGTTITFEIACVLVVGGYSDLVSGGKTF